MPDAVNTVLDDWNRQRPDLDFQPMAAVARLMRLSRLIDMEIKDFLKGYDLEPGEFDILTTVRRSGATEGMTTSAFHKTSLVTAGAITNRLDRMAAKGLVERVPDPSDRRVIRIVLTPHGTELIDTILGAHLANYARLLEPLDSNETDQFVQTLRKLLENLEHDVKMSHRTVNLSQVGTYGGCRKLLCVISVNAWSSPKSMWTVGGGGWTRTPRR